jgi:hypothetical protein
MDYGSSCILPAQAVGSVTSVSNVGATTSICGVLVKKTCTENQLEEYRRTMVGYEEKIKEISRLQVLSELETSLSLPSVKARVIGGDPRSGTSQGYSTRCSPTV